MKLGLPKVLRDRNFVLLMMGKAVSMMGSNMQQFALSLYVLAITGSATLFASMLAISILPRLLLSPVAGVFGDWFDRKKTIVTLDFANGVLIAIFALYFSINGELSLGSIYLLVILLEITEIFFGSAMTAVIPSMVSREELFEANSVRSVVNSACGMLAPLLAAVIYGFLGLQILLVINSISFILSALSELAIHIPATHKKPEKVNLEAFKKDLMGGVQIIRSNRMIMSIIGFGLVLNFALSPLFSVGLIYVIRESMQGTEVQYGVFAALLAFSMILGPITLGGMAKKMKIGRLIITSSVLVLGLVGLLALISSEQYIGAFQTNAIPFITITGVAFLVSMVIALVNIAVSTLFCTVVPREYMGRTGTVMNLGLTIAMPIGQMLFGLALDLFPAWVAMAVVGIIMFVMILAYRRTFLEADPGAQPSVQVSA